MENSKRNTKGGCWLLVAGFIGLCWRFRDRGGPWGRVWTIISGIGEAEAKGAVVFHAGTALKDGKFVNKGGRVLVVSKSAPTIQAAIDAVYEALAPISWENMQYRHDIAEKALKHLQS